MELDYDLVFELQSQLCFALTSHHMFTIKNADDTGNGLFSFIELYNLRLFYFAERPGDWELHIYFIYKWFTCSMLLVSIHEKGYCNTSNELLYVHKIVLDSQCKDGYPGSCGKFEKCKKNDTPPHSLLYILNFGRCKLPFSTKALHVRVTILVSGDAKLFQANQNVKTNVSVVLSKYSMTFSGSVV